MPGPCMTLQQLQAYIPGSCPLQESGPRSRFYPVNCSATDAIAVSCSEISVSQRLSRFGAINSISSSVHDLFHKSPGLVLRGLLASLDNSDLMIDDKVGISPAINGKARLSPITLGVEERVLWSRHSNLSYFRGRNWPLWSPGKRQHPHRLTPPPVSFVSTCAAGIDPFRYAST